MPSSKKPFEHPLNVMMREQLEKDTKRGRHWGRIS